MKKLLNFCLALVLGALGFAASAAYALPSRVNGAITASGTTEGGVAFVNVSLTDSGTLESTVGLEVLAATDSLIV